MSENNPALVLSLTEGAELAEYPISADERLDSHYFLMLNHKRLLSSRFWLLGQPDVKSYGVSLWCHAQNQTPVGTLPDDDEELSALLSIDLAKWIDLRKREISPLYKWVPCLCAGEVRLMHPVITEVALEAVNSKRRNVANREAERHRKRLKSLEARIPAAGGTKGMADNPMYIERLDDWLLGNSDGNRTLAKLKEGMEALSLAT